MKHRIEISVAYGDMRPDGTLRLDSLANYLQSAAVDHAARVGQDIPALSQEGATWVLHRLSAVIERQPVRADELEVVTWATGFHPVRAGREFEVRRGDEVIAQAASTWVYFDVVRGTLMRIPADLADSYQPEPASGAVEASGHDRAMPSWADDSSGHRTLVTLRPSDYDDNGHVNNAAYLDFALAGLVRHPEVLGTAGGWAPGAFGIEFRKEIRDGCDAVEVRVRIEGSEAFFRIDAGGVERARGWMRRTVPARG